MIDAKYLEGLMSEMREHQDLMAGYMERVVKGLLVLHEDLQAIAHNTEKKTKAPSRTPAPKAYADCFEQFWGAYPKHRRNYKPDAYVLWQRYQLNEARLPDVLAALEADKKDSGWQRDGGKYVPGILKWMRAQRWDNGVTDGHERPQALCELDEIEAQFMQSIQG